MAIATHDHQRGMSIAHPASPEAAPAADIEASATRLALQDFAPFALALVPFSVAIGTASAAQELSLFHAAFGACVLLAGTAQLAAVELIGSGSGPAMVVLTVLLINARFAIYGAGLVRWFGEATRGEKLLLALPLVDQSFLCCEERFATLTGLADRRRYYLTGTAFLLTVFLTSELVGYQLGAGVPDWVGLHMAAPLAFAGMLAKAVKSKEAAIAAVVAAAVLVLCSGLPGGLGLPLSIGAGIFAGCRLPGGRS